MDRGAWGPTACVIGLVLAALACSQGRQSSSSASAGSTAGSVAGQAGNASSHGGSNARPWTHCCPPSERPSCCMSYGGFTMNPALCLYACDGMPSPEEGWTRGVDSYGCPIWVEPNKWTRCCGCLDHESEN